MVSWLAYGYVRLLLILEILLFTASLLLHVCVILGARAPAQYGLMLFGGTVAVGIPTAPFIKDSFRWVDQIKSCPKWMWKGALMLGIYGLSTIFLDVIFALGDSSNQWPLVTSGFPLGFDAMYLCILYSVLRLGYLDEPEVIKRVGHSLILVGLGVTVFLAGRAGYLHHPEHH